MENNNADIFMEPWKRVGIHSAEEAAAWRDLGIAAEDVAEWKKVFLRPEHAEPWKKEGFTVEAAWRWHYLGFVPKVAKEWIARGFDLAKNLPPVDAESISEEEWSEWRALGFDYRDILDYRGLGLAKGWFWDVVLGETRIGHEVFTYPKKVAMILSEVLANKDEYERILKKYLEDAR